MNISLASLWWINIFSLLWYLMNQRFVVLFCLYRTMILLSVIYRWFATRVSQLKICDFLRETFKSFEVLCLLWVQRWHKCCAAASFANCVMTLYLMKVHLQTFVSIPITQKCHILSWDTLVTNERYVVLTVLFLDGLKCFKMWEKEHILPWITNNNILRWWWVEVCKFLDYHECGVYQCITYFWSSVSAIGLLCFQSLSYTEDEMEIT